ncbi:MAG: RHS repeat-associated core domain-containing protein [Saprospiraceae bacterium]
MIKDKIDYLRGVEYQSDMPQSIYHSYGRNILQGAYWEPEYHIKDHLGNVRVTFCDENGNGQITGSERRSINDYYAYGMEWNNRYELSDTIAPVNKYRYNGKELFTEMDMDMLNYGARMMDPQLGRMMQPDPRAESFSSITPYQYGLNNPILNIDPTGMYTQSYMKKVDGTREYTIPSAGYNAEVDRNVDNDDPIFDSKTGDFLGHYNDSDFDGEIMLMDRIAYQALTGGEDVVLSPEVAEKEGEYLSAWVANNKNLKTVEDRDFLRFVFTNLINQAFKEGLIDYNSSKLAGGRYKIGDAWTTANWYAGSKGDNIYINIHPVSANEFSNGKFSGGTQSIWELSHAGDAINILGVHEPLHRIYPGNQNHYKIDPIVQKSRSFHLSSDYYKSKVSQRQRIFNAFNKRK